MGGFKIRGMHVDPRQKCADSGGHHFRNTRGPEATDIVHYALRELGL